MRSPLRPSLAAALALAAACHPSVPFELERVLSLTIPAGRGSWPVEVDLSGDGMLWDRRGDVDGIDVDRVRAEVADVFLGNRAASVVFELRFRGEGAPADGSEDVVVLGPSELEVRVGGAVEMPGSAGLGRLLLGALHGSGRFTAIVSGEAAEPMSARVRVAIEGSARVGLVD